MPLPLLPLILAAKRSGNNAYGWREVSRDDLEVQNVSGSYRQDHPGDILHSKFISKSKNLYLKTMLLQHTKDVIKLIVPYTELSLRIRPAR
ncbi:hypothetical protein Bca4012_084370 [Brassica carinata]